MKKKYNNKLLLIGLVRNDQVRYDQIRNDRELEMIVNLLKNVLVIGIADEDIRKKC